MVYCLELHQAGKEPTQGQNTNGWRYPFCLRQGGSIYLDTFAKRKYAGAKSQIYIQLQQNICKIFSEGSRYSISQHVPVTSKLLRIALANSHSYPQVLQQVQRLCHGLGNLSYFCKCSWKTHGQLVLLQAQCSPLLSEQEAGKNLGPLFNMLISLISKVVREFIRI